MADLRDMQILEALGRHRHFARAAAECGISQPAFSTRIRNLEQQLGAQVVKRGNRFMGFTPEGEIALRWARRMMADAEGMRLEISRAKGALSGRLVLGAVPTALPWAARISSRLMHAHPELLIEIRSMSASQIQQELTNFTIAAGITYLDSARPAATSAMRLYDERYVLVAPPSMAPRPAGSATWREAAGLPLCLLTRDMRNRQRLDEIFTEATGAAPQPRLETNALTVALSQVASGTVATIAPEILAEILPLPQACRLPLSEPEACTPIGVVFNDADPASPALDALLRVLQTTVR